MIVNEIKNLSKPFKLRGTIGEEKNMVGEERRGWNWTQWKGHDGAHGSVWPMLTNYFLKMKHW